MVRISDNGTAQPNLSAESFKNFDVPIAPIQEQHRIVAKIEELFSNLDKGIERLKAAQQQLKIYRQSVLKWAFEGRLTNMGAYNGSNPKNWDYKNTSELFHSVTSGSRGWAKYYAQTGAIFIRMGNLDHNTIKIDLTDIQYVKLPDEVEGMRTLTYPGDILISITADVGMIGLIPDGFPESYINQHIALARPKREIVYPPYLAWFFACNEKGQKQFRDLQRGATKVGLGLDDIKALIVPVPPLTEQREVVYEIEKRFKKCEKLEEKINYGLSQAEALRQSILKNAFEGELVPREPIKEPAMVLH